MSGSNTGRAPRSDAEWARDITRRVKTLENPVALRVGPWVVFEREGNLLAAQPGGQLVNLSQPAVTAAAADAAATPQQILIEAAGGLTAAEVQALIDSSQTSIFDELYHILAGLLPPTATLQNLANLLTTELARAQQLADAIFEGIVGFTQTGTLLADITAALQQIPFLNILGIGGPSNIGAALQATWDNWIGGAVGTPGTGAGLADGFNIMNLISSWASQGRDSFGILGILSNKPFWGGMLPSGISNIPLPLHTSTPPTFPLTQSTATTSFKHIEQSAPLGVVSWTGSGLTGITGFFVNIYQMATNGVMTLVHQSANILGDVNPLLGTNIYTLPTALATVATETYGIELAVRGTGTYNILGVQSWQTFDHPTVFPRRLAAVRNSGTTAPSATINTAAWPDATGAYSANIPVIEHAATGGQFDNHQPTTFGPYTVPGTYTLPAASWADFIEVIADGGGGGGKGGQFASDGFGGTAGAWATTTWQKGVNYSSPPTITINVGAGGAGGSGNGGNGGNSTVSIPGTTLTATGGVGATSGNAFGNVAGASPGNITYGVPPVTYVGGGVSSNPGNPGAAPGGGGAGGNGIILSPGGAGAPGVVFIRFRQS